MKISKGKAKVPKVAHVLLLPLYFPLLVLVIFGVTTGGIFWPVSSYETAVHYLPKLASEVNQLNLSFSNEIGQAYAVTFANYLIISITTAAVSILWLSHCSSSDVLFSAELGVAQHDGVGKDSVKRQLVKRLLYVIFLIILILIAFNVPFRYLRSNEISPHRILGSAYMIMASLCSFLSIFLVVFWATVHHLVREILAVGKNKSGI